MTDKIDDGGPAFPQINETSGMSLRDYFAGQAITVLQMQNFVSYGGRAGQTAISTSVGLMPPDEAARQVAARQRASRGSFG